MSIQSEKLMLARCRLMMREPWYGHIAMNITWIPSEMSWMPDGMKTMGVRIVNGGEIQCLYYPPFVDSLDLRELFVVIQHEIEHIVRCHCLRVGSRYPVAWNIAADMCVNGQKKSPRIGYYESADNNTIIPFKDSIIWIPEDWPNNEAAEKYYDMLVANDKNSCQICGNSKGKRNYNGKENDKNKCPSCGNNLNEYSYGGVSGKMFDDHNTWNQSDVSPDEARQVIKNIVDDATEKCQGNVPGHLSDAIKQLSKPIVRWRELLRQYLGTYAGNKRGTYSRRNRRHQQFGTKGVSHHAASDVTVIVDTSGSISNDELQQFFAEIEAISHKSRVWVLQWDSAFQGYNRYRRNDWKRIKVNGRGGTDMAEPINWLCDNQLVKNVQIMLTDGYCNYAENKHFPYICVITTSEDKTKGPDWGHTIRMKI